MGAERDLLRTLLIYGYLDNVNGGMVLRFVDAEIPLQPYELELVEDLHRSLED
jgi:hypothetical protein